jgi:hypothetical protein
MYMRSAKVASPSSTLHNLWESPILMPLPLWDEKLLLSVERELIKIKHIEETLQALAPFQDLKSSTQPLSMLYPWDERKPSISLYSSQYMNSTQPVSIRAREAAVGYALVPQHI